MTHEGGKEDLEACGERGLVGAAGTRLADGGRNLAVVCLDFI